MGLVSPHTQNPFRGRNGNRLTDGLQGGDGSLTEGIKLATRRNDGWPNKTDEKIFIKNYNTKLISIDLPEANLLSSYYLKETFPEKKLYLFENYIFNWCV